MINFNPSNYDYTSTEPYNSNKAIQFSLTRLTLYCVNRGSSSITASRKFQSSQNFPLRGQMCDFAYGQLQLPVTLQFRNQRNFAIQRAPRLDGKWHFNGTSNSSSSCNSGVTMRFRVNAACTSTNPCNST